MNTLIRLLTLSFLLSSSLLLHPQQALAHKIHVFAWVSGNTITVEASFSAKRPLMHGTVTVKDKKSGTVLLTGQGDEKGIFSFPIPAKARQEAMDLLIIVTGSEGHQNQWLVPAAEYLPEHLPDVTVSEETVPDTSGTARTVSSLPDNQELKQMLEELFKQELAPIKRSLALAEERKPGFLDIMGGIGYLLGLAGLAAWLRYRRSPNSPVK